MARVHGICLAEWYGTIALASREAITCRNSINCKVWIRFFPKQWRSFGQVRLSGAFNSPLVGWNLVILLAPPPEGSCSKKNLQLSNGCGMGFALEVCGDSFWTFDLKSGEKEMHEFKWPTGISLNLIKSHEISLIIKSPRSTNSSFSLGLLDTPPIVHQKDLRSGACHCHVASGKGSPESWWGQQVLKGGFSSHEIPVRPIWWKVDFLWTKKGGDCLI